MLHHDFRPPRAAAGERGFSLPEALVGLGLLAVLAALSIGIYIRCDEGLRLARERMKAWSFVETTLEWIRSTGSVPDGEQRTDLAGTDLEKDLPGKPVLVLRGEKVEGFEGLKHVTVRLTWRGGEKVATAETYVGGCGRTR